MGRLKGTKKTGGRQKGVKNRRTRQIEASGILPLAYMLGVMRDESADKSRRDDMSKAAAPYLHARRAPEDAKGRTVAPMAYLTPNLEEE